MLQAPLIDTHAHVAFPDFDKDRDEVIARAREAGVERIVDIGIDLASSRRAVAFAAERAEVHAAVGFHPHDADRVDEKGLAEIQALARSSPKVVAIGETGLDFYRNKSSREGQLRALRAQLDLARELDLPAVLHLRSSANAGADATDAHDTCYGVLKEYAGTVRGVSHCFSGTPDFAKRLVDLGFWISFAGNVSYPSATILRDAAKAIPLERIVLETDCPYLTPQARRGKRNEPAYVAFTAEAVAEARSLTTDELRAATTANAKRLFRL